MHFLYQKKSVVSLLSLGVLLGSLLGYDFISAAWTAAPASPPNNNVEAPINVGNADQEKNGGLTAESFSTKSSMPILKLRDETAGQRDWWLRGEANTFVVAADRNDDGSINGESPWPMLISAGAISTDDYVKFSDQVRAAQYCDPAGGNCFTSAEVSCVSVPYVRSVPITYSSGGTVSCAWNDFGCMSDYCVSEYGGWAGYHAAAMRVSGVSLSSFVCYDWDMTSSCNTSAITAANRNDERSPY